MNKFKEKDILYYVPTYNNTGFNPLEIITYDEEKNKYLCFMFDMDGTSDTWHLAYIKEEELDYLININEDKSNFENLIDIENFKLNRSNLYKYNLYDYDNNKFTLIRKKVNGI